MEYLAGGAVSDIVRTKKKSKEKNESSFKTGFDRRRLLDGDIVFGIF